MERPMKTKLTLSPVRRSLKSVGGFFLLTLFSLLLLSCNLFGPNTTIYNVTLSPGEAYELNIGQGGDEEGANIVVAPLHASVSQFVRDSTTAWAVHYHYIPDSSYTGTDYVKIELVSYEIEEPWSSYLGITTEGYIEINFTIDSTVTGVRSK